MFSCQFNLTEENIQNISKKLDKFKKQEETNIKSITEELQLAEEVNVTDEIEKYLISIVGPIGKNVFDDCVKKLGHTKDSIPVHTLDSVIEMFCCQINLTEENILNISKKLDELKIKEEKATKTLTAYLDIYGEEVNIVEELEEYLITLVGPIGKTALEDSIKKMGHTKDTIPFESLDSAVEMFSCQFNLTEENILNINKKLQDLKVISEVLSKRTKKASPKKEEKNGKKGILSSIFKW